MLRAVVIDDEDYAIEYLSFLIGENSKITLVATSNNSSDGIALIQKTRPDVVYLDVSMPEMDGFQLLQHIDRKQFPFHLIFTTAYQQYAIAAIREKAHDYLLKPIDKQEFNQSLDKIIGDQYYQMKNKRLVRFDDISYIQSNGNDLIFHTKNGLLNERQTMLNLLEMLPAFFVKVHRSYIINTHFVHQLNKRSVLMHDLHLINVNENHEILESFMTNMK